MSDTPEQRAAQVCFELGCRPWTPNERRQVVAAAIREAVKAEREACAVDAEDEVPCCDSCDAHRRAAAAIRKREKP